MSVLPLALRRLNGLTLPQFAERALAQLAELVKAPKPFIEYPLKNELVRNRAVLAAFNLNLQALGYTLSLKALETMPFLSDVALLKVCDEAIEALKEIKGVRNYKPMYPNFPKQVMEASEAELYINAMIHYFSFMLVDLTGDPDKIWVPKYVKDKREPLDEKVELRVLGLVTNKDLDALTTRIATSNTSLSASDKEDLRTLILNGFGSVYDILPAIKNKENLAYFGSLLFGGVFDLSPYFKTVTDVLRLATALSGGDVSLKDDSKFKSFQNSERKFLLGLMEKATTKEEDMLRHRERWVRLGERLHPGTYVKRFPATYKAFTALRNNEHIVTFRTGVEAAVRSGNALQAVTLLTQRPGDFARRLDHILRDARHTTNPLRTARRVVQAFEGVVSEVSTPVLLQVLAHFQHRQEGGLRVVFPKGNVAKVTALESTVPSIPEIITNNVVSVIEAALVERFAALPPLGKVYLDPALADCLVPFSQRSASKSLRTLVRGSKLPFGGEKNTLRFFIWWKEPTGQRTDLDLSAVGYDANWNHLGHISYYNMRDNYAVHSGDITSAPHGACEFIDLNIQEATQKNIRYVVMTVHGFTEQNFVDLPECFAGFMLRDNAQKGEIFDPRTIVDRADLTAGMRDSVPLIIDLVDRKVIWCDAAMVAGKYYYHNVNSTKGTIELLGKAFTSLKKPTLFDLFNLHVEARGTLVKNEEEADVVFSVKAGTPFELDRIASEFMADAVKKVKAATV